MAKRITTPKRKRAVATPAPTSITTELPTHEQIAQRAFEIWLSRGADHGRAEEDWAIAERELRAS